MLNCLRGQNEFSVGVIDLTFVWKRTDVDHVGQQNKATWGLIHRSWTERVSDVIYNQRINNFWVSERCNCFELIKSVNYVKNIKLNQFNEVYHVLAKSVLGGDNTFCTRYILWEVLSKYTQLLWFSCLIWSIQNKNKNERTPFRLVSVDQENKQDGEIWWY